MSALFHNGRYRLDTVPREMRMSHWVHAPVLIDTETSEVLLDLGDSPWDLRGAKEEGRAILLTLAHYPDGNKEYELLLYPDAGTMAVGGCEYPLARAAEILKTALP
ncbi:hypothetical protein Q668_03665 [Alcanivorax sp. PN-3]|jgi:hypothetical protein|nr:hypothetical protein Q668_03665 [Alcanivorax sp. PN-3]KYZ84557.1 hypothetical protein A3Q32_07990 [Alcanivorax sp. KX64203]